MGEPNLFAVLSLVLFMPLALGAFLLVRPAAAAIGVSLLGWMFLPERVAFHVPLLPPVDKHVLVPLLVLAGLLLRAPARVLGSRPGRGVELFAVILLLGTIGTVATNGHPLLFGATTLPAMTLHNAASMAVASALQVVLPFYVGRIALRSARDLRLLVSSIAACGLIYVPLVVLELRMSPQLHNWIYGFHQHEFQQAIRAGGYRPMVFMSHGLTVAMFLAVCLIAAAGLFRARLRIASLRAGLVCVALAVTLLLCKSLAPIVYAIVLVPLVFVVRPRTQLRIAAVVVALACVYPLARAAHVFPRATVESVVEAVSTDRAQSLQFRFQNEDDLLARFAEKPWFGWGQWGRGRIFDSDGRDVSVTDSQWIILFGERGIVGWACYIGLLAGSVFVAARRIRRVESPQNRALLAALAFAVTAVIVDQLPNGLISSCSIFIAGGLLGLANGLATDRDEEPVAATVEVEAEAHPDHA